MIKCWPPSWEVMTLWGLLERVSFLQRGQGQGQGAQLRVWLCLGGGWKCRCHHAASLRVMGHLAGAGGRGVTTSGCLVLGFLVFWGQTFF